MRRKSFKEGLGRWTCFLFAVFCVVCNPAFAQEKGPLRIGVAAMISPKKTISVYQEILYYIESQIGQSVEMVQRRTYADMDDLLKTRDTEIAFICSGPYVKDYDNFGVELLVSPQAHGEAVYYSYLIAHKDSSINTLEALRGKVFAFTDPKSNTGCLVPTYMLAKIEETPDSFFEKYVYSGHHDKSIEMVAKKEVAGAAVDHLIWEYMHATNPDFTSQTKIVVKSPPYAMPPLVVHPGVDPQIKAQLRDILLNMHKDEYGKKILGKIFIDKFIVPKDEDYNSIREMTEWLKSHDKL